MALLSILFEFGPLLSSELKFRLDQVLGVQHVIAEGSINQNYTTPDSSPVVEASSSPQAGFGSFLNLSTESITPVSPDYGIVIEKIDANARVIPDVDPGNEQEYQSALSKGVAAVKGSTLPGQPGNLYIFSHSTDAPWNIIRYNAIFYLLRELEKGDRVIIFYQGRRYDYIVYDKSIVDPHDVSFLANRYDQPVLTLQTCDPPGTLLHRLIIRAKLEGF